MLVRRFDRFLQWHHLVPHMYGRAAISTLNRNGLEATQGRPSRAPSQRALTVRFLCHEQAESLISSIRDKKRCQLPSTWYGAASLRDRASVMNTPNVSRSSSRGPWRACEQLESQELSRHLVVGLSNRMSPVQSGHAGLPSKPCVHTKVTCG